MPSWLFRDLVALLGWLSIGTEVRARCSASGAGRPARDVARRGWVAQEEGSGVGVRAPAQGMGA